MKPLAIISCLLLALLTLGSGCISAKPVPGTIVKCSDYYEITDLYKTPGPEYHVVLTTTDGYITNHVIMGSLYQNLAIGSFLNEWWMTRSTYYEPVVNLTRLNESETGYRDACRVIP